MNPEATIEIRETEHLFYRLDLFQDALVDHAAQQQRVWKSNVLRHDKAVARHGVASSCCHVTFHGESRFPWKAMNGQVNAFMFGLKPCKVTRLAPEYGRATTHQSTHRERMHGNDGGPLTNLG